MAIPAPKLDVLRLSWSEFNAQWRWRQGEHVTLIGPTKSGKTTLETAILDRRKYIVFLSTKRVDSTQDTLVKNYGFKVVHSYKELHPDLAPRVVLRPQWSDKMDIGQLKKSHAKTFRDLLLYVFRNGNWTVVMDEVRYLTQTLGLEEEAQILWLQGRSLGITVVAGTQRPRWVPLEAYDMADHLFFWRETDNENVERIASLAGVNRALVAETVPRLRPHEFLYVYRYGDAAISKVERT